MIQFQGKSEGGVLQFPPNVEQQRTNLLKKYDGRWMKEQLSLIRPLKTYQQVKMHFGLLINSVIAKANDEGIDTSEFLKLVVREDLPTGVGLTKDFLHELLYTLCPMRNQEGRRITLSKMTIDQASLWFEQCRNLLASRGFYIEDSDPNWKTKK